MKDFVNSIFNNDSPLGRFTAWFWLVFGANVMFVLFSLPVVTAGPAFTAMYHVMLKSLREDPDRNPFREFWTGFRNSFKQSMLFWIAALLAGAFLLLEIRFCMETGGTIDYFKYALYGLLAVLLILLFHLFPVVAAFESTWKGQLGNAFFFAARNPIRALLIAALNIVPLVLTYVDYQRMPLYAFLWVIGGFGLIALIVSRLLLKDFAKYLPDPDEGLEENESK